MDDLPPLSRLAAGAGEGKKKKSIVRIPDEFYYQYFTPPHVYSYLKVSAGLVFILYGIRCMFLSSTVFD